MPKASARKLPPPELLDAAPETKVELATIFSGGLLLLATLAACYAAAGIILPVVLAFVLSLVLQPPLRGLCQLGVPQPLAALFIVLSLVVLVGMLGYLLSGPVATLIAELPDTTARLQARLGFLSEPLRKLQEALDHFHHLASGAAVPAIAVQNTSGSERILAAMRTLAGGAFTTVLVLFFLLVAGDRFLRRLVEVLPRFRDKRQAVDIAQQIEHDISVYLLTITLMNLSVGVATGIVMMLCGLGDPLLWGALAFLLNYVPVLGPTAGVVVFLIAGLVTIDELWAAFLPPALYLLMHIAEGETVTPMLLARRFTINPVLVVLSLIFWYWMWGVVGAILSAPMLAIIKIVCDRIETLQPVGHFIEG